MPPMDRPGLHYHTDTNMNTWTHLCSLCLCISCTCTCHASVMLLISQQLNGVSGSLLDMRMSDLAGSFWLWGARKLIMFVSTCKVTWTWSQSKHMVHVIRLFSEGQCCFMSQVISWKIWTHLTNKVIQTRLLQVLFPLEQVLVKPQVISNKSKSSLRSVTAHLSSSPVLFHSTSHSQVLNPSRWAQVKSQVLTDESFETLMSFKLIKTSASQVWGPSKQGQVKF